MTIPVLFSQKCLQVYSGANVANETEYGILSALRLNMYGSKLAKWTLVMNGQAGTYSSFLHSWGEIHNTCVVQWRFACYTE